MIASLRRDADEAYDPWRAYDRRRGIRTASPGISTVEDDRSVTRRTDEPHAIPHVRHVLSRGDWPLIEHDLATRTQELTTSVKRIGERSLFLVGESIADGHWGLPQSARSVGLEGETIPHHWIGGPRTVCPSRGPTVR